MDLRRVNAGLSLVSAVGFMLFGASLALLLRGGDSEARAGTVALGAFAVGMAVVGGAAWVNKTVLEVAFHLDERLRDLKARGG
jgi:hypothetical protein